MGDDAQTGLRRVHKKQLRDAYVGNIKYTGSELAESVDVVKGPIGVVDPRYLGYMYLSYLFIESQTELDSGFDADESIFGDPQKALMLGSALGEYDFIHRRADTSQYKHAGFVVDAIDNEDFAFMKDVETYPIFSVARWHGQDIPNRNMTLKRSVRLAERDTLEKVECEFLYEMIRDPESSTDDWKQNIEERVDDRSRSSLITSEEFAEEMRDPDAPDNIVEPLMDRHYLGKSVQVSITDLKDYHHVLVGFSVEEGVEIQDKEEYTLPNEKIMATLRDEYDGWKMPYIVSGVGKAWGDIIVEMHIDDLQSMNERAKEIREKVDGIQSTKTFLMTKTNFNKPLLIGGPGDIYNQNL